MKWKFMKPLVVLLQLFKIIQNSLKTSGPDSSKSPKKKSNVLTDPAFLTSKVMPPTLKPLSEPALHRDDSLTFQISTLKFQVKSQRTSLSMVSTSHKFQISQNRWDIQYIS